MLHLFLAVVIGLTASGMSESAHAQNSFVQPLNRGAAQTSGDYDAAILLLRLPPAQRAEIARRMLNILGPVMAVQGGLAYIGSRWAPGPARAIFMTLCVLNTVVLSGMVLDSATARLTDGRVLPITQLINSALMIGTARAGTMEEYYLSSPERLEEFMRLPREQALRSLEFMPELAAVFHEFAKYERMSRAIEAR